MGKKRKKAKKSEEYDGCEIDEFGGMVVKKRQRSLTPEGARPTGVTPKPPFNPFEPSVKGSNL